MNMKCISLIFMKTMKKILFLAITLILCICLQANSNNEYYYYNGTKINLILDRSSLNIITKSDFELSPFDNFQIKEVIKNRNLKDEGVVITTIEFKDILSIIEYATIFSELINREDVITVSPRYKRGDDSSIGLSNIFYVKLYNDNGLAVLKELSSLYSIEVVAQNKFMPLWVRVAVTKETDKNVLEMCNLFYETGWFENVDPAFMFNFTASCTNDPYFNQLWGLKNNTYLGVDVNICNAWNISEGSKNRNC